MLERNRLKFLVSSCHVNFESLKRAYCKARKVNVNGYACMVKLDGTDDQVKKNTN